MKRLAEAAPCTKLNDDLSITPPTAHVDHRRRAPIRRFMASPGRRGKDEERQAHCVLRRRILDDYERGIRPVSRDFLRRLNGSRLKRATLFELVESSGLKASCVNYLVYRGNFFHRHTCRR